MESNSRFIIHLPSLPPSFYYYLADIEKTQPRYTAAVHAFLAQLERTGEALGYDGSIHAYLCRYINNNKKHW
jgi:hypothetical protein